MCHTEIKLWVSFALWESLFGGLEWTTGLLEWNTYTCHILQYHITGSPALASYPGLPSQLFSQPWKKNALFYTAAKKAVREGLGTRLGLDSL